MRNLRVAWCQLESHPAIYGGHVAFAEEPFVPLGGRVCQLVEKCERVIVELVVAG